MFPITEVYLDHIHTKNGNPVPVKHTLQQETKTKLKQLLHLIRSGRKAVFTDVQRLEQLMASSHSG
jgi:hypothetical protein